MPKLSLVALVASVCALLNVAARAGHAAEKPTARERAIVLDPCANTKPWFVRTHPDADCKLVAASDEGRPCLRLDYALPERGSNQVYVRRAVELREGEVLELTMRHFGSVLIAVRVVDGAGQNHHGYMKWRKPGSWQTFHVLLTAKALPDHYFGPADGKMRFPVRQLQIAVIKPKHLGRRSGHLLLRPIVLHSPHLPSLGLKADFTVPSGVAFVGMRVSSPHLTDRGSPCHTVRHGKTHPSRIQRRRLSLLCPG